MSVYDAFVFLSSTSVIKHISGTGAFCLSVRSSVSLMRAHPALMHGMMPNFYSMINARFNERRTDANR